MGRRYVVLRMNVAGDRKRLWPTIVAVIEIVFYGGVALLGLSAAAVTMLSPTAPQALDKIRVGLNWVPETEHCGFFQAQAAGLYRKAGLDVDIQSGGPDVNLPLLVAGGRLDLGLGDSFTTLNMVNNGIAGETVAAFFQKDPQTLVVHPGQGLTSLADLKGHPIMVGAYARQGYWLFLKQKYGFTDDQLRPYNFNPAVFLSDPAAVAQGYVTEDGWVFGAHMKTPPVSLLLADDGFDNYAQTVFGLTPWIKAHREAVRRFVAATAEGYRQCIAGDAPGAMKLVLAQNPEHGEALYRFKLAKMRALHMVDGGDAARLGVGAMTDARWASFFHTMAGAGLYPANMDYHKAYTLEFVRSQ